MDYETKIDSGDANIPVSVIDGYSNELSSLDRIMATTNALIKKSAGGGKQGSGVREKIQTQSVQGLQSKIDSFTEIEKNLAHWQMLARNACAAFSRKKTFILANVDIHQQMDFKNDFGIDFAETAGEAAKTVSKHLKMVNLLFFIELLLKVTL